MRYEEGKIYKIYIDELSGEKEVVLQKDDIIKLECTYENDECSIYDVVGRFISIEEGLKMRSVDNVTYICLDTSKEYKSQLQNIYFKNIRDIVKIEEG